MKAVSAGKTAVFSLILAAACVRQAREPVAVARQPEKRSGSPRCVIDAAAWTTIHVDPAAGVARFDVGAERARLSPARDGAWQASVDAPLSFRGAIDEPELVIARAVEQSTLVHLEPGRRVDSVRVVPPALVARAWLASTSDDPGTLEIAIDDVRLACSDVRAATLDEDARRPQRPVDLWAPARLADVGSLALRETPRGADTGVLVHGDGLFAHVLERDADAALVVLQWSDGSRVRGWVDARALREPDLEESRRIGRALGGLAAIDLGVLDPLPPLGRVLHWIGGGHGHGLLAGFQRRRAREPPPRRIRARMAAGTPVYATPGHGRWATVASSDAVFEIASEPSCAWIAIRRAPGLDLPTLRAWVRGDAIRLER